MMAASRNAENTMSDLYFNKANDYSEKNTNENKDLRSTILHQFQFEPEQDGNESHEKEPKYIHVSAAGLLLEQEISNGANVDIAKTKGTKQIVLVVEMWM